MEKLLPLISNIIIIVVLMIFFRKAINKKIQDLFLLEINSGNFKSKALFLNIEHFFDIKEKQKRQTTQYQTGKFEESDSLKLEILRIYSEIEKTVKNKFGTTESHKMFAALYEKDTTTYIILTSMELLRDEILSSSASPKIIKENIDNYRGNADRIIKMIQEMEI
jgi:hypothetical protein